MEDNEGFRWQFTVFTFFVIFYNLIVISLFEKVIASSSVFVFMCSSAAILVTIHTKNWYICNWDERMFKSELMDAKCRSEL